MTTRMRIAALAGAVLLLAVCSETEPAPTEPTPTVPTTPVTPVETRWRGLPITDEDTAAVSAAARAMVPAMAG